MQRLWQGAYLLLICQSSLEYTYPQELFIVDSDLILIKIQFNLMFCSNLQLLGILLRKTYQMSRCSEHNQRVTHFCLHESCQEKQLFGCSVCFKRHHIHIGPSHVVQEQQIQQMMDKLIFATEIKPKCRTMQQSIYNYLSFMKSQISSTLDTLTRSLMNRLSSPFVHHSGFLPIYKKFKLQDYRGIHKDQFKKFMDFLRDNKSFINTDLQQKERSFYNQQSQTVIEIVEQINQIFSQLGHTLSLYQIQFNSGQSFIQKIRSINENRMMELSKKVHNLNRQPKFGRLTPLNQQQKSNLQGRNQRIKQNQQTQKLNSVKQKVLPYSQGNSISNTQKSKFPYHKIAMNAPTQIKKQVIAAQMNASKIKQSPKKRFRKTSIDDKHAIEGLKIPILNADSFSSNQAQTEINKQKHNATNDLSNSATTDASTLKSSFHASEVKQQPTQMTILKTIIHTILPAPEEEKSFQHHNKQVKKKMITIPMRPVHEQEEIASPLLKKKRISKGQQQFLFSLKPVDQGSHDVLTKMPGSPRSSPTKKKANEDISESNQQNKQSQKKINDNQVNSLALLLKALPLSSSQAIPLLQLALKEAKNNLSAAEYLSYLYLEQGKPRQCLDLCNKILTKIGYSPQFDEMSIHLNNNKAAALNMLGRYSESINILERCIRLQNNGVFYKNIGDSYFQIGIPEKAILNYEKAVELSPKYDEAFFNMAVCLYTQQHYLNAHQAILKAIEVAQETNDQHKQLLKCIEVKIKQIK